MDCLLPGSRIHCRGKIAATVATQKPARSRDNRDRNAHTKLLRMSFLRKLWFSRRDRQSQCQAGVRVRTHEEDDFVHVSVSAPAKSPAVDASEEDVDVSSWEMAQVLGRRPQAVAGRRPATTPAAAVHATRRDPGPKGPARVVRRPAEPPADELHCLEDAAELDMFDDKRNRIIKRSHRRKMNFPDKYKF